MKKIVKQKIRLPIDNHDIIENTCDFKHSALLISTIRCIITGPSNCGKKNTMISLLKHPNGLNNKIFICIQNLYTNLNIFIWRSC